MSWTFGDYEIVWYRSEFRQQVAELQTHLWGPSVELNLQYLDWKYHQNPDGSKPLIMLAFHRDQAVAMLGSLQACWEAGQPSQGVSLVIHSDGVVHPDHRRRGLVSRIVQLNSTGLAKEGYDYLLELSGGPAWAPVARKLGYQQVGHLSPAYWWLHQRLAFRLRAWLRKLPLAPAALWQQGGQSVSNSHLPRESQSVFGPLDENASRGRGSGSHQILLEGAPRPGEMAGLIERVGSDGRIRRRRDSAYFAWRFSSPRSSYRFLLWQGEALEGYLVLQVAKGAPPGQGALVTILDWESTSLGVWSDLVRAAVKWGRFSALGIWTISLRRKQVEILYGLGFQAAPRAGSGSPDEFHPSLLIDALSQERPGPDWALGGRPVLDSANWDLRPAYSDAL